MGNFCRNQVITNGKYATILEFYEMHSHNHRLVSLVGCAPVSLSNRKGRAQLNPGRTPNQSLKKKCGKISDSHDSCPCLNSDDPVTGLCGEAVGFVSFILPCQFEGNLEEPSCLICSKRVGDVDLGVVVYPFYLPAILKLEPNSDDYIALLRR